MDRPDRHFAPSLHFCFSFNIPFFTHTIRLPPCYHINHTLVPIGIFFFSHVLSTLFLFYIFLSINFEYSKNYISARDSLLILDQQTQSISCKIAGFTSQHSLLSFNNIHPLLASFFTFSFFLFIVFFSFFTIILPSLCSSFWNKSVCLSFS